MNVIKSRNCRFTMWQLRPLNTKVIICFLRHSNCELQILNTYIAKLINWNIFTHFKMFLADANHNFKWWEIIQIWQLFWLIFQIVLIDVTFYF